MIMTYYIHQVRTMYMYAKSITTISLLKIKMIEES